MADAPNKQNNSIELCSGEFLNLLEPDSAVITPEVLAHHLSQVNRYAGAPRRPMSVAEHTILVSKFLESERVEPETILRGMHHDDSEAFLHDLTRPLKEQLSAYRVIEDRMTITIDEALRFGPLTVEQKTIIKGADNWALSCEAYHLMPSKGRGWWCEGLYDPDNARHAKVAGYLTNHSSTTSEFVSRVWLLRHHQWSVETA